MHRKVNIKIIQGIQANVKEIYLKDQQNKKNDHSGKEKLFRQYWTKVFKISQKNNTFDQTNDRVVQTGPTDIAFQKTLARDM